MGGRFRLWKGSPRTAAGWVYYSVFNTPPPQFAQRGGGPWGDTSAGPRARQRAPQRRMPNAETLPRGCFLLGWFNEYGQPAIWFIGVSWSWSSFQFGLREIAWTTDAMSKVSSLTQYTFRVGTTSTVADMNTQLHVQESFIKNDTQVFLPPQHPAPVFHRPKTCNFLIYQWNPFEFTN